MVFMVLDSKFQAFGNVRLARAPVDAGNLGELRITNWNHIQHRAYKRVEPARNNKPHEFSVPVGMVDEMSTRQHGCDIRLLTLKNFEYWIRFPTDADATIFYRLLLDRIEAIIDDDGPEWPDSWETRGQWTLDVARSMPVPSANCRCHLQSATVMKLMSKARREETARQARASEEAGGAGRQPQLPSPPPPGEKGELQVEEEEELEVEEEEDEEDEHELQVEEVEDEEEVEVMEEEEEEEEGDEEVDEDEAEVPEEEFVLEEGVEALLKPLQVIFEEESQEPPPAPENLTQSASENPSRAGPSQTCETLEENNQPEEVDLSEPSARTRTRQSRPSISPTNQHRPLRRRTEE